VGGRWSFAPVGLRRGRRRRGVREDDEGWAERMWTWTEKLWRMRTV
jgi:hypothetical protein